MDRYVFAKGVVSNAMKIEAKSWYWRGGNTLLIWLAMVFFLHMFFACALPLAYNG